MRFSGKSGLRLVADSFGPSEGKPVILLHGGGQTRHAWGDTAQALAATGMRALSLDLRGHGDSQWAPDADYSLDAFVEDLRRVLARIDQPPVLVGASLGGITALLAQGESQPGPARALVLVDVVPHMDPGGVARIVGFMRAHPDGFTSLDEAADAVAAYLPHRERPSDLSGLEKNLRLGDDGRYRWHWDPKFLDGPHPPGASRDRERLVRAARNVDVPTLLVRGRKSDLVTPEGVRAFLQLVPHASFVDVAEAGHMVAGDRNDAFSDAVLGFLREQP